MSKVEFHIRKGTKEDIPAVHELIHELALFERSPESVITSTESMIIDGFGDNPAFNFHVAEINKKVVGVALYFIKYSTWRGKGLYLDDLIVTEKYRGKGIGRKLFDAYFDEAKRLGVRQLHWQVLDWNTPAIDFYKNLGATVEAEWLDCKINL